MTILVNYRLTIQIQFQCRNPLSSYRLYQDGLTLCFFLKLMVEPVEMSEGQEKLVQSALRGNDPRPAVNKTCMPPTGSLLSSSTLFHHPHHWLAENGKFETENVFFPQN